MKYGVFTTLSHSVIHENWLSMLCRVLIMSVSVCPEHCSTVWSMYVLQSYYRLGVALQGLERFEDAMVSFAEGLAIDPKSGPLLSGVTQTMLQSPLKGMLTVA